MIYLEIVFWTLIVIALMASHMVAYQHGRVSVFKEQYRRHDAASQPQEKA